MEMEKYYEYQNSILSILKKTFYYGFIPLVLFKGWRSMKNPNIAEFIFGPLGIMEQ
ncbi:translocase of outer mitochondrial membrane [Dictyostelium discoideum AX4]|uniref:Translocase of outer mitochondrial membrane n=1 Tax=Dictyostelium discoideum TaxID=44689 RepID=Q54RZ5_DICDI|nr:translocase of outer mitochondrial membrane [Dictyostelium discoideum AX4]EAL66028.1 translocase of outer mitochondrial membrane [Dictyostelium discoideum AX4]|eukprot:XP_639342.1 translocase of outer mitochondrial membrane [Dictyostelium discoideum AX4]